MRKIKREKLLLNRRLEIFDVHNAPVNLNKKLRPEALEANASEKVGSSSQNVEKTEAAARPNSA